MRLISAVSGVRLPAPPPLIILCPYLRRWGNMKKLVTLASVGVFLLSLQGASLAQEKAPATPATPAAPATPAGPPAAAPAVTAPLETPATPEATGAKRPRRPRKRPPRKRPPRKRPRPPRRPRRPRSVRQPKLRNKNSVARAPVRNLIPRGSNSGPGLMAPRAGEGS